MNREAEVDLLSIGSSSKSSPHRLPADGQEQRAASCREAEAYRKLGGGIGTANPYSSVSMAGRPSSPVTDCDCKGGNDADNVDSPLPPGTPPYLKWARNLPSLLEDHDGIELFMQYLKEEDQDTSCLHFLLACQGIRQQKEGRILVNTIKAIYRKFIRSLSSKLGIEPATKEEIDYRVASEIGLDGTIFDAARKEVELTVMKTTYPNFLRSDIYVQHVQTMQDSALCRTPDRVSFPDSECAAISSSEEVQFRQNDPPSPGAEVPPVKKDSSASGSQERVDLLPTVFEDSELHCAAGNKLVQMTLTRMSKRKLTLSRQKPEDQAGHYLKASTPGYSTAANYKYAPYLPPSAQDSASSDAQTDDAISIADSIENYSLSYKAREKTAVAKMARYQHGLKNNASLNVDHLSQNIIPRTQLGPPQGWGHSGMPPDKFAELLTAKLRKVQQDMQMREMLLLAMNNLSSANQNTNNDGSSASNKSNPLKFFNPPMEPEEESQSILDEHVSRVIPSSHQTPRQSPGCLTPPVSQRQDESLLPLPSNQQRLPLPQIQSSLSSNQANKMPSSPSGNFKSGRDSPHFVYNDGGKRRRDRDAYSIDSGLLQDMSSDLESQCASQCTQSREQDCMRRSSYPPNEQNISMLGRHDSGISLSDATCGTSRREKIPSWPEMQKASSVSDSERDSQMYRKRHPHSHYGASTKLVGACSSSWTGNIANSNAQWYGQPVTCPVTPLDNNSSYSRQIMCGNMQAGHAYAWDQGISTLDIQSGATEYRRKVDDEKQGKQKPMMYSREKLAYDGARCKTISKSYEIPEDGALHRKSNRKSCPTSMVCITKSSSSNDFTTVAYCIGRQTVPYLSKIPGKCINLRQFKSLVSKKGNFRYFFKTEKEDIGVVYEEICEDMEVLPIFEGKIFSIVEPIE